MRKLVGLLTAVAAIAVAAPAVAQAPAITMTIGKPTGGPQGTITTVRYGQIVRLSGDVAGAPEGGELVDITVSPYRGEPTVQQVRTDSTGEFTFTDQPTIKTGYSARAAGGASAQEPFAFVRPDLRLLAWNKRKGQYIVTMNADPQNASRVVWFQRRVGRTKWVTVRRVKLRHGLTARFTARVPRATRWVRAMTPQTPGYLRATSRFIRVR